MLHIIIIFQHRSRLSWPQLFKEMKTHLTKKCTNKPACTAINFCESYKLLCMRWYRVIWWCAGKFNYCHGRLIFWSLDQIGTQLIRTFLGWRAGVTIRLRNNYNMNSFFLKKQHELEGTTSLPQSEKTTKHEAMPTKKITNCKPLEKKKENTNTLHYYQSRIS